MTATSMSSISRGNRGRLRRAMAVPALALALASCGGGSQSSSAPATAAAPPVAAPATPAVGGGPREPLPPAMPSSRELRDILERAYGAGKGVTEGKNADYIPVLAKVDPKLFGISVVLANGEVSDIGDARHAFSVQSISKVVTFARILEDLGPDRVEKIIGTNQTGLPFNSLMAIELNEKHRAGNPFVNAGAITAVSLVPANSAGDRWTRILATMNVMAGRTLTVDDEVYRSESATNTRNRGMAWLLKSYKDVITGDPGVALDLYTRQCSVSVTAHDLAVMGATLANGGTNPVTGQHVMSPANAARVLSEMLTTGLYENSGSWSFHVGVPAKSGVGGGIVAVVPGRFAIGTFSPPLDEAGNSVRGQHAVESIAKDLSANIFASNRQSAPSQPIGLSGASR